MCLEAEDGDIVLLGLVELTELATEFVLGDVGTVGVEDVAGCPSDLFPFHDHLALPLRVFLHLHNHLTTTEEGVADELARAQSDLRISHIEGRAVPICVRWLV